MPYLQIQRGENKSEKQKNKSFSNQITSLGGQFFAFIPIFKRKEFSNYTLNNYCLLVSGIPEAAVPPLLVCYAEMMGRNRIK